MLSSNQKECSIHVISFCQLQLDPLGLTFCDFTLDSEMLCIIKIEE